MKSEIDSGRNKHKDFISMNYNFNLNNSLYFPRSRLEKKNNKLNYDRSDTRREGHISYSMRPSCDN